MSIVSIQSVRRQPPIWCCATILATIFLIMLGWTWQGWCDPIVDFGRELYVPWQLSQGKVLYRDIAYFNGPLSPYFNAAIFKNFGASLHALETTNLVLLAGLTAMLFALLDRTFNRLTALVGCVVQLTIFSFIQLAGIGNYNFVTPYSHELTHGILLSVALLLVLRKLCPPSPSYSGERAGVRGRAERAELHSQSNTPLTPTLSPEYEGEGAEAARMPNDKSKSDWRDEADQPDARVARPLTPTLSPEYEGEWDRASATSTAINTAGGPSPQPSPRVQGEGGRFLALVGLLLGLIALTKIEIFIAAAGVTFFFVVSSSFLHSNAQGARTLGQFARRFGILLGTASFPPLLAFILLRCAMPTPNAFAGVLGSFRYAFNPALSSNPFYRRILGVDDLPANLLHIALMFALDLGVISAVFVTTFIFGNRVLPLPVRGERAGERVFDSSTPPAKQNRTAAIACISLASLAALAAFFLIDSQSWQSAFAALPLLLIGIAALQWLSPKGRDLNRVAQIALTLFAFLLTFKMFFAVRLSQYGFALALPAMLALIAGLLHTIPALLISRGRDGKLFAKLCLPLIALILAAHLRPYAQIFSRKPVTIATAGDTFRIGDPRGIAVDRCVQQLRALPPNATVAVAPEGVMISYLAKRVNPTRLINLMPPELIMFGGDSVLTDLQSHPPDYIVYNDFSAPTEYGYHHFYDYAPKLAGWIYANYQETGNATVPSFGLRILKKR